MSLRALASDVSQSPLEDVLNRLSRVKQRGPQRWDASCPTSAHRRGDRSAGLSVTTNNDGDVLLYCRAHCPSDEIVAALGLEWKDLFVPRQGSPPPRPKGKPYQFLHKRLAKRSLESDIFASDWTLAKLLAVRHPAQAKLDILRSWDYLTAKGHDIPFVWETTKMLRGVAFLRYGTAKGCDRPNEVERCVKRLIGEIDR